MEMFVAICAVQNVVQLIFSPGFQKCISPLLIQLFSPRVNAQMQASSVGQGDDEYGSSEEYPSPAHVYPLWSAAWNLPFAVFHFPEGEVPLFGYNNTGLVEKTRLQAGRTHVHWNELVALGLNRCVLNAFGIVTWVK